MFLNDVTGFSEKSHRKIIVECDIKLSEKCKNIYKSDYRTGMICRENNNGKDICLNCSRQLKHSGRNNPNCKYLLDDNFFNEIDSEGKAYLLGWIASYGAINKNGEIAIEIHNKDTKIFNSFNKILGINFAAKLHKSRPMKTFRFCSGKIVKDICKHLEIPPGAKSFTVQFPKSIYYNNFLGWAFIRGVFDGDGSVNRPWNKQSHGFSYPTINIASSSPKFREDIFSFINIPGRNAAKRSILEWDGNNALDVLGKMYDNANYYLERKYELYFQWKLWVPGLSGSGTHSNNIQFKCVKTCQDAILPSKANPSDSGYDLTLLSKIKQLGDVEYYDTGIKAQISYGYWLMMAPRSSMSKTGYTFANELGIIDRSYVGNIIVALRKVNKDMPDIQLPCKLAQLIPIPAIHCGEVIEVESLEESSRGSGGFGSTDRK